ncbi:MAG: hypothetical protein JXB05_18185 [Myxococcaceae bacterium]|nr:hypothetical protein [Myxococcaceae bacterium]
MKGIPPPKVSPPQVRPQAPTSQAPAPAPARAPAPSPAPAPAPRDSFTPTSARRPVELSGGSTARPTTTGGTPQTTSLLTEDRRDGQANCLDLAGDYLAMLPPSQQARAEVLFLRDTRPGAEGQSGHVLIQQGNQYYDPVTRRSYASLEAFDPQGNYEVAGSVNGRDVARILSAPAGSPERQAAIAAANVPPELQSMLVADAQLATLSANAADAQHELEALDQQLAQELAQFGPAMTPEQRQQFITEFQAAHPEYQAAREAQAALATYVEGNLATLSAQAQTDPAVAQQLAEAAEALAGTEHNSVVVQMLNDPALTTAMVNMTGAAHFEEKVLAPAVGTMAAEAAIAAGGDRAAQEALVSQLNTTVSALQQVPALADAAATAANAVSQLSTAIRSATSATDLVNRLQVINEGLGNASPLTKALAGVNFVMGAALAAEGLLGQNPDAVLAGFVQMGQNADAVTVGLQLASRALPSLANAAATAGKVMPLIGVVANTLMFLHQSGNLASDSSRFQAASSFAAAAGGALMLIPGGQIPGAVITAVGLALGAVGSWLQGQEEASHKAALSAEAQAIMARLDPPVDPAVISAMAGMSPETVASTQQQLGLTPESWVTLAHNSPEVVAALQLHGPHLMDQLHHAFGIDSVAELESFMATIAPQGSQSDLPRLFAYLASESTTNTTDLRLEVIAEMQSWRTEAGEYQMVEGGLPPDQRPPPPVDPFSDLLGRVSFYLDALD